MSTRPASKAALTAAQADVATLKHVVDDLTGGVGTRTMTPAELAKLVGSGPGVSSHMGTWDIHATEGARRFYCSADFATGFIHNDAVGNISYAAIVARINDSIMMVTLTSGRTVVLRASVQAVEGNITRLNFTVIAGSANIAASVGTEARIAFFLPTLYPFLENTGATLTSGDFSAAQYRFPFAGYNGAVGDRVMSLADTAEVIRAHLGIELGTEVWNEVPAGTVNGVNTVFTLAHAPTNSRLMLFRSGLCLKPGGSHDYTLTDDTITFTSPPETGENLLATYKY